MALNPKIASLCYILAPAYHGAQAVSERANKHPDILSLGTCNPLTSERQICSCGEDTQDFCPFWTAASKVIHTEGDYPFGTMLPQAPFLVSNKALNTWLNGILSLVANEVGPKAWKILYESAERFYGIHERFLTFCQDQCPHKVFLDGERSNLKFMVLASMGFPVGGAIHMVRDPRGYAAAWKRYYPETPVESTAMEWAAAHTRIRRLKQVFPNVSFLTLTYEELIGQPTQFNEKLFKYMGLEVFIESEMGLNSSKNHLIGVQGADFLPAADEWKTILTPEEQNRVVQNAGPLFAELGYKK